MKKNILCVLFSKFALHFTVVIDINYEEKEAEMLNFFCFKSGLCEE